jgi:hypothetical protein
VQADTIVPGAGNPAAWNRYGYVGNNPIKRIDPSGHIPISDSKAYFDLYYQFKCQGSRYCELANGAVIDWTHFNTTEAANLIRSLEKGDSTITLSQASIGYDFSVTFKINYVEGVSIYNMGAGIWVDFQQMFESWQGDIYVIDLPKTSQSPEDVPSTYLAYLAVANNLGNDLTSYQTAIVELYGGGRDLEEKPDWMTEFNSDAYQFQIPDGAGGYTSLPYPEVINIAPASNDGYWHVVSASSTWKPTSSRRAFMIGVGNEILRGLIAAWGPDSRNPFMPFP